MKPKLPDDRAEVIVVLGTVATVAAIAILTSWAVGLLAAGVLATVIGIGSMRSGT